MMRTVKTAQKIVREWGLTIVRIAFIVFLLVSCQGPTEVLESVADNQMSEWSLNADVVEVGPLLRVTDRQNGRVCYLYDGVYNSNLECFDGR